jgi:GntR family transcriptional regulator
MFLRIEKGSATPISRQIAQQISALCAAGSLAAGDRLSSVRELSRELGVNQNTILRVYERLSRDGLLEMRQGQGTFVAAQARKHAAPGQRERLVEQLRQIVQQGSSLGLEPSDMHELLDAAVDQVRNSSAANG